MSFAWSSMFLMLYISFFISFIVFFNSIIFICLYYSISFCLLNLYCLNIVFLISLNIFSVFSYSSMSFFRTMNLSSLMGKSQVSISLRSVTQKLLCSFDGIMFSWFFNIPRRLPLLSSFLKKQLPSPVSTDWLRERNTFHQSHWRFWSYLRPFLWIFLLYNSYSLWGRGGAC